MDRSIDASPRVSTGRFASRVALALFITGLALLVVPLAHVLLFIFAAALIAVILRAIADPMRHRLHLPQSLAVLIALLLVFAVMAGGALLFGTQIASQFSDLLARLPSALDHFKTSIADLPYGQRIIDSVSTISPDPQNVTSKLFGYLSSLGGIVSNAIVVLFAGIYLALSPAVYRDGAIKLFPKDRDEQVGSAFDNSARALKLWLLGQLVSMTLVGLLTGLGLWAIGVPSPLALGLIAGLAEFIPLVGPVLSAIPGLLISLTVGAETALWALVVYVGVQQVESNLITPQVEKHVVSVPPALTLLGILALGSLFGPLGVLVSAPLVVVLFVLVKQLYVRDALGHETSIPGSPD